MSVGRILGVAVLGFLFTCFIALDLVLFGVIALDSAVVTVLPVVGLVVGAVLGALAGRRHTAT